MMTFQVLVSNKSALSEQIRYDYSNQLQETLTQYFIYKQKSFMKYYHSKKNCLTRVLCYMSLYSFSLACSLSTDVRSSNRVIVSLLLFSFSLHCFTTSVEPPDQSLGPWFPHWDIGGHGWVEPSCWVEVVKEEGKERLLASGVGQLVPLG